MDEQVRRCSAKLVYLALGHHQLDPCHGLGSAGLMIIHFKAASSTIFIYTWDTINLSLSLEQTALKEISIKVGEEGDVASKSFQVDAEKEEKEGLRHRGVLKLDHLADSTAYWAALTTITQVWRTCNAFKRRITPSEPR